MALWQHRRRHLPVQLEVTTSQASTTTAFSSLRTLPPTSETIWILVPFSNVFCPLVPHYIMPLSNLLPLGASGNQTYAIRSVPYPNLCAHEANFTNSDNLNPSELPCLSIYILAEIFVFKIFTVIMLPCNSFEVPDQVSLFRFFSVIKLCSSKLENWPLFIFFQWNVTTSNAGFVTINHAITEHYMFSQNDIEVVGMPIKSQVESESFELWTLVQSNTSCGFK